MVLMKTTDKGVIMCMDEFNNDWENLENIAFDKEIRCYTLVVNKKRYDILGPFGIMHKIDQKSGNGNGKVIHPVVSNPKTFFNRSKEKTTLVIPYGFWTCECEKNFVRTFYSSECPICKCSISNTTNRAKYLEEIKFV